MQFTVTRPRTFSQTLKVEMHAVVRKHVTLLASWTLSDDQCSRHAPHSTLSVILRSCSCEKAVVPSLDKNCHLSESGDCPLGNKRHKK